MKWLAVLSLGVLTIASQNATAQAKTFDVCSLVPAAAAAQLLGHPVDTSHSGDTSVHCLYVGKSGGADLRVMPFQGDDSKVAMMMGHGRVPPGHSLAYGRKGGHLVYVSMSPKDDRAAQALLKAAMAKL